MTALFNKTINKNETRATGKPPADYEAVRKILKSLLRESGYSPEEPTREDLKNGGGATDKQVMEDKKLKLKPHLI